jgi:hypothetical protein
MNNDEIDLATIERYRKVLEEAAAQLGAGAGQRVAGATAAVFAALDKRDHERRELLGIARALAGLTTGAATGASPEVLAIIERARKVVG